jgi:hypothetical protein
MGGLYMTTNKKRINAYLSHEAFDAFQKFCQQEQFQSQSSGIEFLIQQFLIEGNPSLKHPVAATKAELEKAIATLRQEYQPMLQIGDRLDELMGKLIA